MGNCTKPSMKDKMTKGVMEGPLRGKVRAAGQQGLQPEGQEDQDTEDKPFNDPVGALVKNCNMLHNIVGPACIFLKRGFSQTLLTLAPALHHASCVIPPHHLSLVRVRRSNLLAPLMLKEVDHSVPWKIID
ncbi:calcium-binding protein 1-like [Seriola aureovittata]|uniref:calcium-binding protein 1-like n=1 Tax=Seriola aureovittata TaxID=2871759 RepID=UPI0024BE5DFA|nr:calcium-binding protein 1-like [Seriola aureovittata]